MMRLTLIIVFMVLITAALFSAQTEYVTSENRVYDFLERMETLQIITDYNAFEIPKTRSEIAEYIKTVVQSESKLDAPDREFLDDLKIEFEYDLYGTLNESERLIGSEGYDFLSQKQKYLYYYNDPEKINLFVNLTGEGNLLVKNDIQNRDRTSAFLGIIGGEIRGTILNKFGLFLKGTRRKCFREQESSLSETRSKIQLQAERKP